MLDEKSADPNLPALSSTTAQPSHLVEKDGGGRRVRPMLSRWVRDIVISLAVSAFFIIFLYQPVKVEGTSMMPTLEDQERVFINKFVYRLEPIQRGDVVVFRYPRDPSKSYIKRVIAVAGDRVRIEDGLVYVNDKQISEAYVPANVRRCPLVFRDRGAAPFLLCDGRSSQPVERQPRLRSRGRELYLRQGRLWLLAVRQARQAELKGRAGLQAGVQVFIFQNALRYEGGLISTIETCLNRAVEDYPRFMPDQPRTVSRF